MMTTFQIGDPGAPPYELNRDTPVDGHTLVWAINSARFELLVGGDAARLRFPDGQLVDLTNREWTALANAIGMVVKTPEHVPEPAEKRQSTKEKGTNTGIRWTEADDADLLERWSGGARLSDLMMRFDRNEVGSPHAW